MNFFSVKMRASRERDGVREHISGAEHMVAASEVPELARDLVLRAQNHSKGVPDFINIKVEEVPEASCLRLKALPVRSLSCETAKEGLALNNGTQMMTAVGLNVLWDAMSLANFLEPATLVRSPILVKLYLLRSIWTGSRPLTQQPSSGAEGASDADTDLA